LGLHHAGLDVAWRSFLRVVADQGDFGVVAIDREAVAGWARYAEGQGILKQLMSEMAIPALDSVRHEIATVQGVQAGEVHAEPIKKGISPVWTWQDRVHLRFAVPARAGEERLRIQFYAYEGEVHFCVEARYPDAQAYLEGPSGDPRLMAITAALRAVDPRFWDGYEWESYWSRWHPMEPLLERGENPAERLLEWVREDVRVLAQEGLFDALQELSEAEAREPEPAHDE
jgi:hypothetical protein